MSSALALTGCATGPRSRVRRLAPSDRLNVAGIGCGGKGHSDVQDCAGLDCNIVALCDVDDHRAAGLYNEYPDVPKYRDFRVMLERHPEIDAVTISTADHTHAPAAMVAMQLGKHVFIQKPLCHTVYEARMLAWAARYYGVASQMGNQGHAGEGVRQTCEAIWSGELGHVREVHAGTDRPWWPQNVNRPDEVKDVPGHLDWDLFLGPAPPRPYHDVYHPFNWRGWWDFGCGALGDMGCHILDPPYMALKLHETYPTVIEVLEADGGNEETPPAASIVRFDFPARGDMPPVSLYWYDGGKQLPLPEGMEEGDTLGDGGTNGSLFIGDKGAMTAGTYGGNPRLLPGSRMKDFQWPEPYLPRSKGHMLEFVDACKGGPPAGAEFDYAGHFTEMVLLGNVALRAGGRIEYDGENMRITNDHYANRWLTKEYRAGFEVRV